MCSYSEKWRERYASCSTVCWLIKMAGKYSNSSTFYSPVKIAGKLANMSTFCSPVKMAGKILSARAFTRIAGKIGQQIYSLLGRQSKWRQTYVCEPLVRTSIKVMKKILNWSNNMARNICQIDCCVLACKNGGKIHHRVYCLVTLAGWRNFSKTRERCNAHLWLRWR